MMIETLLRFPCGWQKKPLVQWNKYASRDCDDSKWQLVGVPTGVANGFDVLDVDVAGLGWLDGVWDRLPPTRAHATRSGGRHLFFKHADGLRNSAGRIAEGVDVRADGGLIVWWPRQGLRVLSDARIAEWPDWLLSLARGSTPAVAWVGGGDGGVVDGPMGGKHEHATDSVHARAVRVERTSNFFARCKVIQRKVEQAELGKRNLLLHWAACRFGNMVFEGVIKPDVAALLLERFGEGLRPLE